MFSYSTTPVFRNHCNFTEDELKSLSRTMIFNIAEAIDDQFVFPNIKNIDREVKKEDVYKTIPKDDFTVFDKYIDFINKNISIRMLSVNDKLAVYPRLMIYMQCVIHAFVEHDGNSTFILAVREYTNTFNRYAQWECDFGEVLEYICNKAADCIINEYYESLSETERG